MFKIFRKIVFFFCCMFLCHAAENEAGKLFNKIPIIEYKLENGLSVVILKKSSPVTAIATIVGTGSLNDPYKKSGLAHFVEHCMFEGLNKKNNFSNFVKKTGAMFNAYTGFKETVFFTVVPNDYIDQLFNIESLRLKKFFIHPKVASNEKNVVLQEAFMYQNKDVLQLLFETMSTVMKNSHYSIPVVGYTNEIKQLSIKDVVNFIKKYYVPNNMKLVIISEQQTDKIIEKVKKYFGTIKKQPLRTIQQHTFTENNFYYHVTKKSSQVGMPIVYFTYVAYDKLTQKERIAINLICHILEAKYEHLYNQIVKKDKIASSIDVMFNTEISGANAIPHNVIIISMTPLSQDYQKAENILQKRIFEIVSGKISNESLQYAKSAIKNSVIVANDSFNSLFCLLRNLGLSYSYKYCNESIKLLNEIDVEYVNKILQKYFGKAPNAMSVITPKNTTLENAGGNNA